MSNTKQEKDSVYDIRMQSIAKVLHTNYMTLAYKPYDTANHHLCGSMDALQLLQSNFKHVQLKKSSLHF